MSNTAIIVSDAWAHCLPQDIAEYPRLEKETRLYCEYLNHVMEHERSKGNVIIHDPSNRPIIDCMTTDDDYILSWKDNVISIPTNLDRYLLCGFHYGRCIHEKLEFFSQLKNNGKEVGVIINLSHWLYKVSVQDKAKEMMQFDNYIWTPKEITKVDVKFNQE